MQNLQILPITKDHRKTAYNADTGNAGRLVVAWQRGEVDAAPLTQDARPREAGEPHRNFLVQCMSTAHSFRPWNRDVTWPTKYPRRPPSPPPIIFLNIIRDSQRAFVWFATRAEIPADRHVGGDNDSYRADRLLCCVPLIATRIASERKYLTGDARSAKHSRFLGSAAKTLTRNQNQRGAWMQAWVDLGCERAVLFCSGPRKRRGLKVASTWHSL